MEPALLAEFLVDGGEVAGAAVSVMEGLDGAAEPFIGQVERGRLAEAVAPSVVTLDRELEEGAPALDGEEVRHLRDALLASAGGNSALPAEGVEIAAEWDPPGFEVAVGAQFEHGRCGVFDELARAEETAPIAKKELVESRGLVLGSSRTSMGADHALRPA